jgi:DNA-binding transcriptional regulator YhcF (GntR family)
MYKFDGDTPIFLQIAKDLELKIISGELKSGDRLGSVRDLAREYIVNPNTIQKAMSVLENDGLVDVHRGVGRTVSKTKNIESYKKKYIVNEINDFTTRMKQNNVDIDELINSIKEGWEDGSK